MNSSFTEKISSQIRVRGNDDRVTSGVARANSAAGVLPRPVVSLPARMETGLCAALPSWSRVQKIGTGGNATISGTGDAPASLVKMVTEDGVELMIERTWVRTSRTWELARQITTTPDKRYRDEVVYEHQSASGERVDRALPVVACADNRGPGRNSTALSRGFYSPHSNSLASRLFPLSETLADYSCDGDCFAQQNAVYTADVALVSTATVAAYACTAVAVVVPAACLAAGVAWAAAVANLAFAQRALNHCLYMQDHPGGVESRLPGEIAIGGALAVGDAAGHASQVFGTTPMLSASCSSGGGLAGGGTIECHPEDWEISYDGGETWRYLTTVQVCENVL